jgi:hypothetical protein
MEYILTASAIPHPINQLAKWQNLCERLDLATSTK